MGHAIRNEQAVSTQMFTHMDPPQRSAMSTLRTSIPVFNKMAPRLSLFLSLPLSTLLPRNPSLFTFVSIKQRTTHCPQRGRLAREPDTTPCTPGCFHSTTAPLLLHFLFLPPPHPPATSSSSSSRLFIPPHLSARAEPQPVIVGSSPAPSSALHIYIYCIFFINYTHTH
jgi:hypothetical protein